MNEIEIKNKFYWEIYPLICLKWTTIKAAKIQQLFKIKLLIFSLEIHFSLGDYTGLTLGAYPLYIKIGAGFDGSSN